MTNQSEDKICGENLFCSTEIRLDRNVTLEKYLSHERSIVIRDIFQLHNFLILRPTLTRGL